MPHIATTCRAAYSRSETPSTAEKPNFPIIACIPRDPTVLYSSLSEIMSINPIPLAIANGAIAHRGIASINLDACQRVGKDLTILDEALPLPIIVDDFFPLTH